MSLLPKGSMEGLTEKSSQPAGSRSFYVGAAWDGDVDLDLVAIPLRGNALDTNEVCYFNRHNVFGGAIAHSGDALTGDDNDGDDESLKINTDKLPTDITAVVIGVIAYNVDDMSEATNTKFTIRDGDSESSPELYTLPMADDDVDGETVLVACTLIRGEGNNFSVKNIGEFRTEFDRGMKALEGFVQISPNYAAAA